MERAEEIELIKEQEMNKRDAALFDIERIQANGEAILRVLQVQLTKTLMDISSAESQLEKEKDQYWLKELPIHEKLNSYMSNVTNLINIYTQQEDAFKTIFANITQGLEYPEFNKVEASYVNQINELYNEIQEMKENFEIEKDEIDEKYEQIVDEKIKKAVAGVHREYESLVDEMELRLEQAEINNEKKGPKITVN